jgi:membrane protease YdiL (CAAX protease family)
MENTSSVPAITWLGLALALFGVPLIVFIFNQIVPQGPLTNLFVLEREISIFAVTGLLLWVVISGEKLGLGSIGLYFHGWGRSILWGVFGAVMCVAALAIILFIFSRTGISYGSGPEAGRYTNVSPWIFTIVVIRAGIVEEICYRGYVIERLEKMTGNWLIYIVLPLVLFALFHYRQGLGGIIISFVAGAILALLYLKRRDLKANIITHFLVDFVPNVLLPLVSKR